MHLEHCLCSGFPDFKFVRLEIASLICAAASAIEMVMRHVIYDACVRGLSTIGSSAQRVGRWLVYSIRCQHELAQVKKKKKWVRIPQRILVHHLCFKEYGKSNEVPQ